MNSELSAVELILSFIVTWLIGLFPPLLLRYAIFKRPIEKKFAIAIIIFLFIMNLTIFIVLGSQNKTHAVLYLIALISYRILNKGYVKFKTREDYENWKSERLKKLSEKTSHVKAKPEVTIPMAIVENQKRAITGEKALWIGGIAILIVASLITFQLFLRYQEAEVGFFDIKYDRIFGTVYIKHINAKEWRETKFKSLRHAKAALTKRQIEDAVEDIGGKVRDIEDKLDELQNELQR
ncbi:MAG: hypothetical protein WA104_05770 [Thermodesulfovibrionales bacterium]